MDDLVLHSVMQTLPGGNFCVFEAISFRGGMPVSSNRLQKISHPVSLILSPG